MKDTGPPDAPLPDLLTRAADEARRWDRPDLATRLEATARAQAATRSTVLVVGPPGSGKSTLVDALLDVRVCTGDLRHGTTSPVLVTWSDEPRASVVEGQGTASALPLPEVSLRAAVPPARGTTYELVVGLPRRLLGEGLDLVDTPGLSGGMESAQAASVLLAADTAGAVLYVVDPSRELSALDAELLRRVSGVCPRTMVALAKIDAFPEWRRLQAVDEAHLRKLGLDLPVLPLSAPLRYAGLRRGDDELLLQSGYPQLAAELRRRVLDRAEDARVERGARALRLVLGELVAHATTRRGELVEGASALTAEELAEARAEATRLQTRGAKWQQVLTDQLSELVAEADVDLTVRVRGLRKAGSERLEGADPSVTWRTFEPWLYERTNEEMLAHFGQLRAHTSRLVRDVSDAFGHQAVELQRALDSTIAAPDLTDRGLSAAEPARSGRGESTLHAARGASLGASMTLGVGHGAGLLGLTVLSAGWALPATAAVAAVVLGRRMLRSAKDAQLRTRRAEAMRAVTAYLDEAELLARTESRAAVRRVHHQVRDHFTETAADLQAAAVQRLREVEGLARAGQAQRSLQLDRLDADLRRLRPLLVAADALMGPP